MNKKMIRRLFTFFVLAVIIAGCGQLANHQHETTKSLFTNDLSEFEFLNGEAKVLIKFRSLPGPAEEALVRALGGKVRFTYRIVPAIAATVPEPAINALRSNPRITVVEPDVKIHILDYASELDNTWGVKRIGAGDVHSAGNEGDGIKVAVLDTGIDYNHPELSGVYAGGYDFVNKDEDPMDDEGHGTHVAGTIAAARNGYGVVGVAPKVKLYALKVLDANGSGSFSNVIAALQWCVENGVQITNNSYGSSKDPGTIVKEAFDAAYNAGILHVASAGNSGNPTGRGDNVGYPARYTSVIAVAATTKTDSRASYSSTGPDVELAAPGSAINSTLLGGGYGEMSGTSMASPHVAGAAALVWYANPTWSNEQVRQRLIETAEDLGPSGRDPYYGYGLVRADLAVGSAPSPEPEPCMMHVDDITMSLVHQGSWVRARATVKIVSSDGQPVEGAIVYGEWSGAVTGRVSATTDSSGKVTFTSARVRSPSSATTFTFCVTEVVKDGWIYDSDANVESCDSISVP
jgi:subtilisin